MEYSVYIVELYSNNITGFTAYKRELLAGLKNNITIKPSVIVLEYPIDRFSIEVSEEVTSFQIPQGLTQFWDSIVALLSMHIYDSPQNCFILNYSPASSLAQLLRDTFPQSRIITVVHDFRWTYHLMGDLDRFRAIIGDNGSTKDNELIHLFYNEDSMLFRLSDVIVCLSQDSYDIISSIYQIATDKLRLIPNGLRDFSQDRSNVEVRAMYNIPKEDYILLYSGRVSYQKGIMEVFACFKDVLHYYPNSWLVLAGGGDSKVPPEIRLRVISLGQISQEDLFPWYKAADLGLLPSFYEQCSYTGIEMKMFGLPVVASNGIGVRCMFGKQDSIVAQIETYTNLSNYRENLKNAILQFLSLSPKDRKTLGHMSRKHYEEAYTQTSMIDRYINLIHEY